MVGDPFASQPRAVPVFEFAEKYNPVIPSTVIPPTAILLCAHTERRQAVL